MASTAAASLACQRASGLAADGNLRASESVKFRGANAWRDGRPPKSYRFHSRTDSLAARARKNGTASGSTYSP